MSSLFDAVAKPLPVFDARGRVEKTVLGDPWRTAADMMLCLRFMTGKGD